MIKKLLLTSTTLLTIGSHTAAYAEESATSRLNRLEKEIKILKRQQEVQEEEAATKAEKSGNIDIGKKGIKISSADGNSFLNIRGYAHFDNRTFINDGNHSDVDNFLVRRARPIFELQHGDFSFRLMPDFAGGTTRLFDAYADYKPTEALNFRIGKFKAPVGLEHLKSRPDDTFIDPGLPTNLVSNRDTGVMTYGNILPEIEYQLAWFNGNADRGMDDTDTEDSKDVAARIFIQPFKRSANPFSGLGFGVGGTLGERSGSTTSRQLGSYVTSGQSTFFQYSSSSFANGEQWRLAPQAYYYYGPFGFLGEYTISSQELQNGSNKARAENNAWQTQFSYVLTGEDAGYKGVTALNPFDPSADSWGAWEIAAKVGELTIDDSVFPRFASSSSSAKKAHNYGAALNGYLNDTIKVSLDYEHTRFQGGAAAGADREDEQVLLTRIGYKF
jgi:phosphate-selective porin OprO/OprP